MRIVVDKVGLCAVLSLMALPCRASVTFPAHSEMSSPERFVVPNHGNDAMVMHESLRKDVALHPDEFVVFATGAGAKHFLDEHYSDVEKETDPRMVVRGVMGYWQGKTVVVLPWINLSRF